MRIDEIDKALKVESAADLADDGLLAGTDECKRHHAFLPKPAVNAL